MYKVHLILAGHAHGGQIRIGNQGFYSPGQELFSEYTKGIYDNRLAVLQNQYYRSLFYGSGFSRERYSGEI